MKAIYELYTEDLYESLNVEVEIEDGQIISVSLKDDLLEMLTDRIKEKIVEDLTSGEDCMSLAKTEESA